MHCETGNHSHVLPFIPLGEVFSPPPAPTQSEADHCELRDIKSLLARDPNIASTINAVGQGMKLVGVIDTGSIGTRDLLVAVCQITEDDRRTKEERKAEMAKQEAERVTKRSRQTAQQDTHHKKENKKAEPAAPDFAPLMDFAKGGKSPFETLSDKEEKTVGIALPRLDWEDIRVSDLFTKTIPLGTPGDVFRNQRIALAA